MSDTNAVGAAVDVAAAAAAVAVTAVAFTAVTAADADGFPLVFAAVSVIAVPSAITGY